jgi:hypothetical protein
MVGRRKRAAWGLLCAATAGVALAGEVRAQTTEVDLELVLAVDVSRSMDLQEQAIQRAGYVAAFRDEDVVGAMLSGYRGRVAITYMEWANEYTQFQVIPWTLIETREQALAVADALEAAPISAFRGTSISGALAAAAGLIEDNAYDGAKRVIDISGDGSNRDGPALEPIRAAVGESGIIVNGLPLILDPSGGGYYERIDLEAYYRENVITGPGAFVIPVRDVETLASSIRSKLILEIAQATGARELAAR